MLSMMEAMGNLAQEYNRNKNWSYGDGYRSFDDWSGINSAPWPSYGTIPQPGVQYYPEAPASTQRALRPSRIVPPVTSPLDGIWQGQGGEIVLVMYGRFRIYADADRYRDGSYRVDGKWILMRDPATGAEKSYEFALDEGRLALRGIDGTLLLFRQLPIPVPPYSIFTGQNSLPESPSSQSPSSESPSSESPSSESPSSESPSSQSPSPESPSTQQQPAGDEE
jgi:hypothetical protein